MCAFDCSKTSNKNKNPCPVWWNIDLHMIIKITYIAGLDKIQEGKIPSLLQFPCIPKNNDGDDNEDEHINVESDVQSHENNGVG